MILAWPKLGAGEREFTLSDRKCGPSPMLMDASAKAGATETVNVCTASFSLGSLDHYWNSVSTQ